MSQLTSLTTIKSAPCPETVAELEALLDQAHKGEIVGLAYVALIKGQTYEAGTTGSCREFPDTVLGPLFRLMTRIANR